MQQYNTINKDDVINIQRIYARQKLIHSLKNRFSTYGYDEIHTPTFEAYDLYANMNGTVNHQEMIKTIDNTGQVLVLRPDITIPLTQKIAANNKQLDKDLRYFYVLDVFRHTIDHIDNRESTQAGVEYFGNFSEEADAEVIALAVHTLRDLKIDNFKIEIGHAGFFKEVIKELKLAPHDLEQLKQFIQAKNITEIKPFLARLSVNTDLTTIIETIPLLYGNPEDVLNKAQQLPLTDQMQEKLQDLRAIFEVLQAYNVESHLVFDLGLINHMDYYSDVIFQGFIELIGKPVLMGGRYNRLADQFQATIPAIGFACDVDLLLEKVMSGQKMNMKPIDFTIYYKQADQINSLTLANHLRQDQYRVLTYPLNEKEKNSTPSLYSIQANNGQFTLIVNDKPYSFTDYDALNVLLQKIGEKN